AISVASAATLASGSDAGEAAVTADSESGPVAQGEQLVGEMSCTACHATDNTRKVGPGWGGLYNSQVKLDSVDTATADDAYLAQSIRDPDARIVDGYPAGVMPAYDDSMLTDEEVQAIVAY